MSINIVLHLRNFDDFKDFQKQINKHPQSLVKEKLKNLAHFL